MGAALQPSLFDAVAGPAASPLRPLDDVLERTALCDGAWIDVGHGWLRDGGELFDRLRDDVPWRAERRPMYDRVVDVPRLLAFYGEGSQAPDPLLAEARSALSDRYAEELGEPFVTYGCCLYRDGRDSVAWHGDTIGRSRTEDTMVAILSLGSTRRLLLRPRRGGPSTSIAMENGDLVVMGGSCQRTWEHAIPKTARPVGPRISVQLRTAGVR